MSPQDVTCEWEAVIDGTVRCCLKKAKAKVVFGCKHEHMTHAFVCERGVDGHVGPDYTQLHACAECYGSTEPHFCATTHRILERY